MAASSQSDTLSKIQNIEKVPILKKDVLIKNNFIDGPLSTAISLNVINIFDIGEYILYMCQQIGRGAYGTVNEGYLVKKVNPDYKYEKVAIKSVLATRVKPDVFEREISILQKIKEVRHENILYLYGVYKYTTYTTYPDNQKYLNYLIVTEYIEGYNLEDYLKRLIRDSVTSEEYEGKILENDKIGWIIKGIFEGMIQLHKNNIAHRDLKLDNIMYNPETNKIKIIDFGLSCIQSHESFNLKCKGIVGAFVARSPELFIASENIKILGQNNNDYETDYLKQDSWSMGVILYVLTSPLHQFDRVKKGADFFYIMNDTTPTFFTNIKTKSSEDMINTYDPVFTSKSIYYDTVIELTQTNPSSRLSIEEAYHNLLKNIKKS